MLLPPLRAARTASVVDIDDLQMDCARSSLGAYDAARDRILVRACLLEVSDADRELLELCLFHGWSVEEVAGYLGEPELAVSARISEQAQRLAHRNGTIAASAVDVAAPPALPALPAPPRWLPAQTA